jgi:galactose-1-phosphate uridylyltransferase
MQELGHGKQRRLKAQLLWDILEPDTVSKVPNHHPAVISEPQHATWSSGSYFQKANAPPHHLVIILKITHAAGYHSALTLKR